MTKGLTTLETLTDTAVDSCIGYEQAAEKAKSPRLKTIFTDQAAKRRALVGELNAEIARLGGSPRSDGTFSGAAHRVWMQIADAFEHADEAAAERVEEGEDYIEKKFREALDHAEFAPQTLGLVQRAHAEIAEGERLSDRLAEEFD